MRRQHRKERQTDTELAELDGYGAGIGLRKGQDALKTELNAAIKALRANGVYKKINDKYFKIDVYGK